MYARVYFKFDRGERNFQGRCCLHFLQFAQFSLPKAKTISWLSSDRRLFLEMSRDIRPNNSSTWVDIYRAHSLFAPLFSKLKSFLKIGRALLNCAVEISFESTHYTTESILSVNLASR